nr:Fanconi anemia group I protein [Danaus plexippus plexippus]
MLNIAQAIYFCGFEQCRQNLSLRIALLMYPIFLSKHAIYYTKEEMEPNDVFKKIKEFGQSLGNREKLIQYCNSEINAILKVLPKGILSKDGAQLIDCILKGLSGNAEKKCQVISIVLKTIREQSMTETYWGDLVSRLSLELSKLPIDNLLKWSSDSVQTIIDDSDVNMIWGDILPECLNIISTYPSIRHCGTVMSGVEYKIQCIQGLCQCTWREKQLIQLTAMFKDIQLTKENHKQVVNKICSYMDNLPSETLPPLVHHLLKLCKQQNLEIVLCHLSHYFNKLYAKLQPPAQDSEATTMDVEDIVLHSEDELRRCQSTCLYHLSQGLADPELIRKHMKQWPKIQLFRDPFLINVALAVSDKGADFASVCLDVIKSAIELTLQDELRRKESAWAISVLPLDYDVASVLKALVIESTNHRQMTVLGLINLAFSLLSVYRLKPTAPQCWALGQMLLVKLSKTQPETASHILSQLADKLFGDSTQTQYSECLYILCKQAPVVIERCPQIILIVESCQGKHAVKTFEALKPLLSFSERTRDTLLKVCRKHLYSGDLCHRRLSVSGFLCVLRHTRLSSWSESSSQPESAHSYLTQLAVDVHTNRDTVTSRVRNESMFMEIVSILRRCLVQDVAVKQYLYTEIYNSVKDKAALHESILEMLNDHLSKYLPQEGEGAILMDDCVSSNGELIEPIGHLLFTIAQFLQNSEDESDDILSSPQQSPVAYYKNKLTTVMQKICQDDWLSIVDLESLSDLTVESKVRCVKVQQILQCYEALMAHKMMQWNLLTPQADAVLRLHKAYNQLLENTKASPKVTKKAKANETKDSTLRKSPNDKVTTKNKQKEKGKAPVTFAGASKDRGGPFKPLPCVWDLALGLRVLQLLYSEEVPWSSSEHRNQVRSQRSFNLFAVRAVQGTLVEGLSRHQVADEVLSVAGLVYTRCICKFHDVYNFDEHVTYACLELFKACLNLLLSNDYAFKTEDILSGMTCKKDATESVCMADLLGALFTSLDHLESERADDGLDAVGKKTYTLLVQICTMLMDIPVKAAFDLSEVLSKLESLCRCSPVPDVISLSAGCLTAAARDALDSPLLDDILKILAARLDYICGEVESSQVDNENDFPAIDDKTGHTALAMVCAHLTWRLKCVQHLLLRAKDLSSAVLYTPYTQHTKIRRELTELYEAMQVQLCQLTTWTASVASLRCVIGAGSDKVLNLCVKLYSLLATYVKLMDLPTARTLHLEKLLKLSGRKLSQVTDELVSYVEASQPQKNVLKDTKVVPRLVKAKESFNKNVVLLGEKSYQQYISLGNARDFKIVKQILEDKLNALEPNTQATDATEALGDDIDDASTVVLDDENESDVEDNRRKRRSPS